MPTHATSRSLPILPFLFEHHIEVHEQIVVIVVPVLVGVILCVVGAVVAILLWQCHKKRKRIDSAAPVIQDIAKGTVYC